MSCDCKNCGKDHFSKMESVMAAVTESMKFAPGVKLSMIALEDKDGLAVQVMASGMSMAKIFDKLFNVPEMATIARGILETKP